MVKTITVSLNASLEKTVDQKIADASEILVASIDQEIALVESEAALLGTRLEERSLQVNLLNKKKAVDASKTWMCTAD